ncbi:MAG TPA: hypothetical protein VHI54_09260 [Actinomycetota bacterium]|nr:hypothetical protein [Actinomycetota bacterium]
MRRRKAKQLKALGETQRGAPSATGGPAGAAAVAGPRTAQPARKGQKRRKPRGPARQTRWMRVLGLLIATGGGVVIGFGWAGAAQVDCVECQIPFLLSGGAAGIGLIIFGVALMLLAQIRTESRRLGDRIEHALGLRMRPEDQQRAPTATTEPAREQPAAATPPTVEPMPSSPIAEPRGEDAAAAATTTEPRADEPALASEEQRPNPLSAVTVDSPAEESGAPSSDAATVAATTVAGGVVDAEGDSSDAGDTASTRDEQGSMSVPAPQAERLPEVLGRRSDPERRRGLFRRRKGP